MNKIMLEKHQKKQREKQLKEERDNKIKRRHEKLKVTLFH
jgi:hypothetical protein